MAVSLDEYSRVLEALEIAINTKKSDISRDATIQRFEFCVELAWKTAKKIMATQETLPKQIIREMAQAGIIEDTQIWFDAITNRNLSSHTYNKELAEKVYAFAVSFLPHGKKLKEKLSKL